MTANEPDPRTDQLGVMWVEEHGREVIEAVRVACRTAADLHLSVVDAFCLANVIEADIDSSPVGGVLPSNDNSRPHRFDQCDETCTVDCGHCKGAGRSNDEPTPPLTMEMLDELRELWHAALEREGNLASAVADVVWKATAYGTTEDGDVYAYIVPKGCMHRLVGVAQSNGAHVPVAFRNLPEESGE